MKESYHEILESFTSHQYFGNVHCLETAIEGIESCYYIELKPRYPQNKDVQFATLWRLLQEHDSTLEFDRSSPEVLQEQLREQIDNDQCYEQPSTAAVGLTAVRGTCIIYRSEAQLLDTT